MELKKSIIYLLLANKYTSLNFYQNFFKNSFYLNQELKLRKLNDDFDEIDERLTAGWYVCSGQRKRYLKSIIKDKK